MDYTEGTTGRVFVARFDHGDDVLRELAALIEQERIRFSSIALIGALAKGRVVAGPEKLETPAAPSWINFDDGRELIAYGTSVYDGTNEPSMHIHGSFGRGTSPVTGCMRGTCITFITVEAVVTEINGADILRKKDPRTGHDVLYFGRTE